MADIYRKRPGRTVELMYFITQYVKREPPIFLFPDNERKNFLLDDKQKTADGRFPEYSQYPWQNPGSYKPTPLARPDASLYWKHCGAIQTTALPPPGQAAVQLPTVSRSPAAPANNA